MPQHARASLALAEFDRATRVPAAPVADVENVITSAVETVLVGGSVDVDALAAEFAAAASEVARLATRVPHRRDVDGVTVRYGHLRPTGSHIPRKHHPDPTKGYPWATDDPLADLRHACAPARVPWCPSLGDLGAIVDAAKVDG